MITRFIGVRSQVCRHGLASMYMSTLPTASAESSMSDEPSVPPMAPHIISQKLDFPPRLERLRRTWVENMDSVKEKKLGLIDLHPDVFAVPPRIDIIHENIRWQKLYRRVDWTHVMNRAEMPGGGRKPWQQKGLGKARHGSVRSPIWIRGGKAHGPRSPKTHFYMLPFYVRLLGLRTTVSTKLAQDDLHVVKSLDIPTSDPLFIEDLINERLWGPSVLFVDVSDMAPENIALATEKINHVNIMPLYGLNVYSMVKHDTLVLTLAAIEELESKILFHLHRTDMRDISEAYKNPEV